MSHLLTQTSNKDHFRKVKDNVAKYGVTTGGLLVLAALLMIFFYLLYVVKPIFNDVEIHKAEDLSIALSDQNTLALGLDEHVENAYRFTSKPSLEFYDIHNDIGRKTFDQTLEFDANISTFSASAPHLKQFAFGFDDGTAVVIKPGFRVTFPNDVRKISPTYKYPLGKTPIILSEAGESIEQIAFTVNEEAAGFLFTTQSGELSYTYLVAEENFMTDELEWQGETLTFDTIRGDIQALHISPDLSRAFVIQDKLLSVIDLRDIEEVDVLYQLNVANTEIVASTLLPGANSILIAETSGVISQWFEINGKNGREFIKARQFETGNTQINALYPEFYRKTFFAASNNGQLGVYHTTSEANLFEDAMSDSNISHFAVAPRSNAAIMQTNNSLQIIKIENEHPEVTWSAIWQEVWYEGYPEPDYIWQSTSAGDDFESKFSLVPISFGTIKAALYAMLFSVPIGLAAAIYTAYFMPSRVRKVVKPTIEIMEALPTVILGFLAGLWLAPLVEENLPGIVVLMLLMPVVIIGVAYAWHVMPKALTQRIPEGMDSIILIPVILLLGWVCFSISPAIEQGLFNGDMRLYITDELGIDFDQRNSFVVGIAMGFAVIPTIFSITEDAVFSVPKQLSHGSLALGASQWQTLTRVVLLTASPGIFSAVMMGLGRAVGETMIVLMATGNTPVMDWSIFQGMRTLSANIAVEMPESEVGSSHYRILFLAAFVLFVFTFLFNTAAEFVRQRLREKYSSL
ncbi:phosphate ABC transporter permease [Saccharobesus litoralis]|uniref:Phosphate ABC transporter permease n=1 Tax=Saccharobesus litoralis TaxID=2172099 RepID=A0A2S0VMR6_9ALTE|nr:ABC transporter permease subunit [Saccharobesus litoralis]AWB65514.1 phosphate ABC transporter permease [Saccharobesus litoralis]